MSTYAVLLENYVEIPHLEWGKEIADLLEVHYHDTLIRLRRQQGIVWEGLDRDRADKLGAFLIGHGYPAGLVSDEDIVRFGKPDVVRNGDVVEGGFEIEDIFGDKQMIEVDSIILMQVGWVKKKVETGSSSGDRPKYDLRGARYTSGNYSRKYEYSQIGWIMHIFTGDEPLTNYRIISSHFNYDYQGLIGGNRDARFGILLSDLAKLIPFDCLDKGFRVSMGSCMTYFEDATYDTLAQMLNRARWALTIRKVVG